MNKDAGLNYDLDIEHVSNICNRNAKDKSFLDLLVVRLNGESQM